MLFPAERFNSADSFFRAYRDVVSAAYDSVSTEALDRICARIETCYSDGHTVYVCGNGGSAAIANHFACDHGKGVRTGTGLLPRVVSLAANVPMISALANDISYDDVFAYQLEAFGQPDDVLLSISSSGDSENVVRAIRWANDNRMTSISFTGFEGGRSREEAALNLHVTAQNYGVIEDLHLSLMQIIAQYIRQRHVSDEAFGSVKF